MSPHSGQAAEFTELASHLHFGLENCPTCGQTIPPNKLEEISGRIAAKERERTLAITAQLDKQYAIEKARSDAKAKADLETERRSSEQIEANLQAQVNELRESGANALEAIKAEAKEREIEIKRVAKRTAESSAAERIAAIEAAQRQSEAGLQARINEAEASRIAAEQKETVLALQVDELRQANVAEVVRVKEEAATELLRIRQLAGEEAETHFRDKLTANENAVVEASARAREAETKVLTLTDQHETAMKTSLNEQREILDKDKENAVNAEKARAFEENQKLSSKVSDLQRAMENRTAEELGEGAEINLFDVLKKEFPDDKISRIRKGIPGADILHIVMLAGKECGTILYDSKNHNQFRNEHVAKLRADQLAAKAEHAILSTHKFPQGTRQLHKQDGVLLANPARVVFLATIVRQHLLQVHTLRLSDIERASKTTALYEFIISDRCSQLLVRIDERAESLLEQQTKEVRWHEKNWSRQGEAIRAIQKAKVDLENQINLIVGTSANDGTMPEAS